MVDIRCRVVACHEGTVWNFYLINDSAEPIDSAVLSLVGCEWGDIGNTETVDVHVDDLAPGAHARIWQDDGSGAELRMELRLRIRVGGSESELRFEFPKLYNIKTLPLVEALGRPGWTSTASE